MPRGSSPNLNPLAAMSLINEALKKAQRVRTEEPADPSAAPQTAAAPEARIAKRGKATSANTMVLIGSGAIVVIVLSVVLTVFLLNRPATAPTPAPTASATPSPKSATPPPADTPTPVLVGPVIPPPTTEPRSPESTAPSSATQTASAAPSAGPATTPAPTPTDTPVTPAVAVAPATIVPATPPPPPTPDDRITAFVEAIKVAGIRSSGSESRVLMNDRVYRVNDIVERTLGVKLIKVGTDNLVFSDPKGATYVKNF
jgi:hypothetical protein